MKKIIFSIIFISNFLAMNAQLVVGMDARITFKTNSDILNIEIENLTTEEFEIPFSPSKSDTIPISLYLPENNSFKLYSDIDTISFIVPLQNTMEVVIRKKDMKPAVLIIKNGLDYHTIRFEKKDDNNNYTILYEKETDNPYLQELRSNYPLDSLASLESSDVGKVQRISAWVNSLWQHDEWTVAERPDALYILSEVKKGRRFRCVEYGIVTAACLNAIGLDARRLSLKSEDVETRESGAGHVLTEVFVNDLNKWVMVDSQFGVIPYLYDVPLNAVELQAAVTNREIVNLWSSQETTAEEYIQWVYPYLYYFNVSFDNRYGIDEKDRYTCQGKTDLMLVPLGVKNPTVFQKVSPLDYCIYTHSLNNFYAVPPK